MSVVIPVGEFDYVVETPTLTLRLSMINDDDKDAFVRLLSMNDAVYKTTLRIPFPYSEDDAIWFINFNKELFLKNGYPMHFAIRDTSRENVLIGVCGLVSIEGKSSEIGYWIGEEYWGRGLMQYCVRAIVEIASHEPYNVEHFTAGIFSGNSRSTRVVEKAGFTFVRHVENAYEKKGTSIDADEYELRLK